MSAKNRILFIGALASSLLFALPAGARDHRDDHRGDRRDDRSHREERHSRDRHDRNRDWHRSDRDHHRDRHYRTVWSKHRPRPHFYASHMPPPLRHEWRPHRPSHRHVWIPGYWSWGSGYSTWLWVDGYWALPPRSTVVYVAPRYERVGSRVTYVEGGWCESDYAASGSGAATGAILGGVAGGVIGHQSKDTGVGVLIGALVGSVIGHQADVNRAEERSERIAADRQRAELDAKQDREDRIALGESTTDAELEAAQARAELAKAKLAAAKADQQAALSRAKALERAKAEAEAAEAELQAMGK